MASSNPRTKMDDVLLESLDHTSNGVVITDATKKDNPIIYVNRAFSEITGYSPSEVIGKNCRFLQGNEKNQANLDRIRQAIRNGKNVVAVVKNFRKDKTVFWNELHISPITISKDTKYFIGIQNDITARKQAETELNNYKKHLEKLVEERTKELTKANLDLKNEIEQRRKSQEKITRLYHQLSASAKNLQLRLSKAEKKDLDLTKNERKGFIALTDNNVANISIISKQTGIPVTTLNSQKKRFNKDHRLYLKYYPRIDTFGYELISIILYEDMESGLSEKEFLPILKKFLDRQSSVVMANYSPRGGLIVCANKEWAAYKIFEEDLEKHTKITSRNFRQVKVLHFPVSRSRFTNFFSYAGLARSLLAYDTNLKTKVEKRLPRKKFSKNEQRVILGYCQYPSYSLNKMADRTSLSKPTISTIKNDLISQGYLKPVFSPNLPNIGAKLLLLSHYSFNTMHSLDISFEPSNEFFSILTTSDYFSISAFGTYQELQSYIDNCTVCKYRDLKDDQTHMILPLDSITYSKEDYASIIKKI